MNRLLLTAGIVAIALPLAACQQDPQDPKPSGSTTTKPTSKPSEETKFARFVPIGDDEGLFETAIVTYENAAKKRVSLISSIHIADKAHYVELQEEFTKYDALLYELVGPEDYRPKPGDSRGNSILSLFQMGLKNGLELEFQLDGIDYTPKNFVHADLTPEGFADAMDQRGESIITIMFDMMARQADFVNEQREAAETDEQPAEKFDIVKAFRSGEGRHQLRMMVAKQLMAIEALAAGGGTDGEGEGSVLLEGRNDRALEVLAEQLKTDAKKIGIYYGAAHMPDIEKKMIRDMGFKKVETRWLKAWDIHKRPDKKKKRRDDDKK